ncbi:tRNA nucleotidyltransferase/poly(A) polymerase family protein [Legionella hackeliae]|uniref:Polynucleotide adenylyltransferase n=1 Tax=Legionella hackeliae TaxID=449 RepID=A0A0A8UVE9_LEGHA|nr:CCA tRNA nucleotidyltransferase [Legionella hackeliae]KTD11433.1 poly(A) polymerase I [Legionella hackeliae]CEK10739.1 Polynucleotide adenylyltransferase [Legionella hackeliae]STX47485.1 poly(A) polymerase I [Legionella hackeliae]
MADTRTNVTKHQNILTVNFYTPTGNLPYDFSCFFKDQLTLGQKIKDINSANIWNRAEVPSITFQMKNFEKIWTHAQADFQLALLLYFANHYSHYEMKSIGVENRYAINIAHDYVGKAKIVFQKSQQYFSNNVANTCMKWVECWEDLTKEYTAQLSNQFDKSELSKRKAIMEGVSYWYASFDDKGIKEKKAIETTQAYFLATKSAAHNHAHKMYKIMDDTSFNILEVYNQSKEIGKITQFNYFFTRYQLEFMSHLQVTMQNYFEIMLTHHYTEKKIEAIFSSGKEVDIQEARNFFSYYKKCLEESIKLYGLEPLSDIGGYVPWSDEVKKTAAMRKLTEISQLQAKFDKSYEAYFKNKNRVLDSEFINLFLKEEESEKSKPNASNNKKNDGSKSAKKKKKKHKPSTKIKPGKKEENDENSDEEVNQNAVEKSQEEIASKLYQEGNYAQAITVLESALGDGLTNPITLRDLQNLHTLSEYYLCLAQTGSKKKNTQTAKKYLELAKNKLLTTLSLMDKSSKEFQEWFSVLILIEPNAANHFRDEQPEISHAKLVEPTPRIEINDKPNKIYIPIQSYFLQKIESALKSEQEKRAKRTKKNIKQLEAYLVGGFVRDSLANLEPNDFDLVINLELEEIKSILEAHGIYGRIIGKHHPILIVINPDNPDEDVDISTLKGDSLQTDAESRDFKINSLYYNLFDRTLHDPMQGREGIKNGKIETNYDADKSVKDDPLRMLRAIRLKNKNDNAKNAWRITEELSQAIKKNASSIVTPEAFPERRFLEFKKIINNSKGHSLLTIIDELNEFNLLTHLFPFVDLKNSHQRMLIKRMSEEINREKSPCYKDIVFFLAIMMWTPMAKYLEKIRSEKFNEKSGELANQIKDEVNRLLTHYAAVFKISSREKSGILILWHEYLNVVHSIPLNDGEDFSKFKVDAMSNRATIFKNLLESTSQLMEKPYNAKVTFMPPPSNVYPPNNATLGLKTSLKK